MRFLSRRGQSSMEYLMYAVVVLGVIVSMMSYFKRGVQGRWKESIDNIGDQFDPRLADGTVTTAQTGRTISEIKTVDDPAAPGGVFTMREDTSQLTETVTGSVTVAAE